MRREQYIEQIRRMIYGGQPDADAEITVNLVNQWLDIGIAVAAKANYTDNIKLDGIAYVNNSFYTTFKNLEVEADEQFLWKVELPHIPFGLGNSEGISTLVLKDNESRQLSYPFVWLSENQRSIQRGMRPIPNKLLAYSQGKYVYIMSELILTPYTAQAIMVSGGNSTDLQSELNVPGDYMPVITEYLKNNLMFERMIPKDVNNDGNDAIKFT